MRYLKRRHVAQPGVSGRLALIDELARANPLVVSPYLRSSAAAPTDIDPVSGLSFTCGIGGVTPQPQTDQGAAYSLPGDGTHNTEQAEITSAPYQQTVTQWSIIAIVRSVANDLPANGLVVATYSGISEPLFLDADPTTGVRAGAAAWDGSNWYNSGVTTNVMGDGKWHVIAGRYKGANDLSFFLDGRLDAQNTTSIPASIRATDSDVYIGRYPRFGLQWNGNLLLVVLVLTALDISFLRQATQSIPDCWASLFRPESRAGSVFHAAGGGGGSAAYRWFLTQ